MLIQAMEYESIPFWDIRFCYHMYINKLNFIYPVISKVRNIGTDGSGSHCGKSSWTDVVLDDGRCIINFNDSIEVDDKIALSFKRFYNGRPSMRNFLIFILKETNLFIPINNILKR